MKRALVSLILIAGLASPLAFSQRRQGSSGRGTQQQKRIHTPGTGQQTGTAVQQRQRKRDGTGPNCTGDCLKAKQQTQTRQQTQAEQKTQTQEQTQTSNPK